MKAKGMKNAGKNGMSPKARHAMKREAEKNVRKREKTCKHDSIAELFSR